MTDEPAGPIANIAPSTEDVQPIAKRTSPQYNTCDIRHHHVTLLATLFVTTSDITKRSMVRQRQC